MNTWPLLWTARRTDQLNAIFGRDVRVTAQLNTRTNGIVTDTTTNS